MKHFLTRIRQSLKRKPARDPVRYASEREQAQSADIADRLALAQNNKTHPEILYYLATHDASRDVRQAVIENKNLPLHVTPHLAHDPDTDIRIVLADRICTLLPGVSETQQAQLYGFLVQALGTLALDEVLKVRVALSSAIQHVANAPPKVVSILAKDVERSVSEPILRSCVALPDADLLAILRNHPAPWAVQAISGRPRISETVAQAVVERDDEPAGVLLLENKSTQLTEPVLRTIVDKAETFPTWQKPLALYQNLPSSLALALAAVIDISVRDVLLARQDFDPATINEIANVTRRRMDMLDATEGHDTAQARFKALRDADGINDASLLDALGLRDRELAILILAALAKTSTEQVAKILQMRAPKPILALCWKAKLPMRTALVVQRDLAGLNGKDLMLPKGGTDYPMPDKDLEWQIEFLGI